MHDVDLLELDAPYGVHLHHEEHPGLGRARGIKSAAQALAKWEAGTSNAAGPNGTWVTNLRSTTKPIVAAAIAQQQVMVRNFQQAVNDGTWAAHLQEVGDAGIKAAALDKSGNYGNGTAAGSIGATKMGNFLGKLIQYETANLPQIYAMAKGTPAQGKARMDAWFDIMVAAKGQLT
jgi:hypothetical protein